MKKLCVILAVITIHGLCAPAIFAQDADLKELKAEIQAMQKTITDQNARIATLEKQVATQKSAPAPKTTAAAPVAPSTAKSSTAAAADINAPFAKLPDNALPGEQAGVRDTDNLADLQQAAPRANNAPLDPSLKGFIAIPGTDTMFKIGGSARIDAIGDFKNNGNPNLFTPSTIPVPGQPGANGGGTSTLETKGTRLSLELRRPVPYDSTLRIYTEFDFYDNSTSSSMNLRARHFYGQAWNFLIGQTFSAFMDPDVFPDVVDYQGPNGIVNRRQPQIRYTQPIHDEPGNKIVAFASIEQPSSQIDTSTSQYPVDSSPVSRMPDGILGFRWEGLQAHVQASGVLRDLSFENDNGLRKNTLGWGGSLSAGVNVFDDDKLSAQVTYGEGVARYINDLGGQNLDAAFENGRLKAIPAFAVMGGYTHQWSDHWRSTISAGYVKADAPDSLGPFAIDDTFYGSVNLMWHPTTTFRMGLEYLYGRKETANGASRDAQRIDFVIRYDLVR